MKIASNIFTAALLAGCQANQGSLEQWYRDKILIKENTPETEFVAESKADTISLTPFNNIESSRLFFPPAKQKQTQDNSARTCKTDNNHHFLQQEAKRVTASFHYRGYLSGTEGLWALIEPLHGNYYRLKQGAQLHGEQYRLKEIKEQSIVVQGQVADNFGCVHSVVVTLDLKSGRNQ